MKNHHFHAGQKALAVMAIVLLSTVVVFMAQPALAAPIAAGFDLFQTLPGGAVFDLSLVDSGFPGVISMEGLPLGTAGLADTIVERLNSSPIPAGGTATIPIEIIALSLVSSAPVSNPGFFGDADLYDVNINENPGLASTGTLTIKAHDDSKTRPVRTGRLTRLSRSTPC